MNQQSFDQGTPMSLKKIQAWQLRPSKYFDIPIYLYRLYLSVRAGSFLFFSNANPCMTFSGFAGSSKYADLMLFDREHLPKMILVTKDEDLSAIEAKIEKEGISYPCIVKPNRGRNGNDVKKIYHGEELMTYLASSESDIIVQELVDYPLEYGVFYHRIPGEEKGHITSLVEKSFFYLIGDGVHSLGELVVAHPRAKLYEKHFHALHENDRDEIIPSGEKRQLSYIGNHCKWSIFYDRCNMITPALEEVFDDICKKVDGFYFGRFDLKTKSVADLYAGHFKLLEANGVGSEPTHIYDPDFSIRPAYRSLLRHRKILYRICRANRKRGIPYLTFRQAREIIKQHWYK